MNKIYRSVWNEITQTYVAAAEIVRGKGKRSASSIDASAAHDAPISVQAMASLGELPKRGARLVFGGIRPLALEQRFMFDGAAVADAVDAVDTASKPVVATVADSSPDLFSFTNLEVQAVPSALVAAQAQAEKLVGEFLNQPDAKQQLFTLFNGGQSGEPSAQWNAAYEQLMSEFRNGDSPVRVELRSAVELQGAKGAFAAAGTTGEATIYLNSDWLAGNPAAEIGAADSASITTVLVEELGHYLDAALNKGGDTAGDEGEVFSRFVLNGTEPLPVSLINTMDDHGTLTIDGQTVEAEFASFNFVTAYQIVVDINDSSKVNLTTGLDSRQLDTASVLTLNQTYEYAIDKESSNHNFIYTSTGLGQVTVNDDVNSIYFSGNDVSAIGLNIGGTTYYGWISRPIKVGGQVVGFYFWTDVGGTINGKAAFGDLATAQADGNQDGDSSTLDNRAFVLVVNKAYFDNTLGFISRTGVASNTYKVIGSSSDRVDSALNGLILANVAPVATPDVITIDEDTTSGSGNLITGLVPSANGVSDGNVGVGADTDADGDTLRITQFAVGGQLYTINANSSNTAVIAGVGSITISSNGNYTFTPTADYNGTAPLITYTVTDPSGATATSTLTVNVTAVDDPSVLTPDNKTVREDSPASGNVLSNDSDIDSVLTVASFSYTSNGSPVNYSASATPRSILDGSGNAIGTIVLDTDGTYIFTPASNWNGTVPTITYTTNTGLSTTLIITVTPVNDAPTATDDTSYSADAQPAIEKSGDLNATDGQPASGNVLTDGTNDSDPDGDTPTVAFAGTGVANQEVTTGTNSTNGTEVVGQYGTLTIGANGSYSYVINDENRAEVQELLLSTDRLTDLFSYQISDGHGGTDTANLTITIQGANDNPRPEVDYDTAKEHLTSSDPGYNASGTVKTNDSDVDSNFIYSWPDATSSGTDLTFSAVSANVKKDFYAYYWNSALGVVTEKVTSGGVHLQLAADLLSLTGGISLTAGTWLWFDPSSVLLVDHKFDTS